MAKWPLSKWPLALSPENRYIQIMTKTHETTSMTVRDTRTGKFVTVRGAGSLKDSKFAVKKGVDLTKPIAKQVLKGRTTAPMHKAKG